MEIDDLVRSGWPPTEAGLRALLDEVCVDAHGPYEQATSIHGFIEDLGGLPAVVFVGGQRAALVGVDLREASLVAVSARSTRHSACRLSPRTPSSWRRTSACWPATSRPDPTTP